MTTDDQLQPGKDTLPTVLRGFCLGLVLLFLGSWGAQFVSYHVLHLPQIPYCVPTLDPGDNYVDIKMFRDRIPYFHSLRFFDPDAGSHFLYPAPIAVVVELHRIVFLFHERRLLTFIVLVFVLAAAAFFYVLRRRGLGTRAAGLFVIITLLFGYPTFFEYNRANVEIVVWGLVALGIVALARDRPWLAAALFGLAGSMKFYPAIFLLLLFPRKQFRQIIFGGFVIVLSTVLSLWLIAPDIGASYRGIHNGLEEFRDTYVLRLRPTEIGFDHSLVGLYKRTVLHMPPPEAMARGITIYLAIVAAAGCVLYFARIRRLPFANQVLCLSICAILLPPLSYDYTLLHLYYGWAILVLLTVRASALGKPFPPGLVAAFVCFTILLGAENEFILHGIRFGAQIKAMTLVALLFLSLWFPYPSEFDHLTDIRLRDPVTV